MGSHRGNEADVCARHIAGIRLLTSSATIYHARSGLHRESTAFRGAGLLPISLNGLRVTNGFDAYLRRTNVTAANGATVLTTNGYTFDAGGRLSTARDGTFLATYSYLANSPLVSQIEFKSNTTVRLTTTKTYDQLNRLTSIASVGTGSTPSVTSYSYSYNDANQRTRVNLADGSFWIYEYDSLGQVKSGKRYWSDWTHGPARFAPKPSGIPTGSGRTRRSSSTRKLSSAC